MVAKSDKKLPKGVGEVPEWWMDLCPHHTYESPEDNARIQAAYEEAMIFDRVSDELKTQYGGNSFPNWNPAENGPLGEEMTKDWESKGYKRDPSTNKWVGADGKPLQGRQFTIKPPKGYKPGAFSGGGGGSKFGGVGLRSPTGGGGYANDAGKGWEKPAWTTKKLKSASPRPPAGGPAKPAQKKPSELEKVFKKKDAPDTSGMSELQKAFAKKNNV